MDGVLQMVDGYTVENDGKWYGEVSVLDGNRRRLIRSEGYATNDEAKDVMRFARDVMFAVLQLCSGETPFAYRNHEKVQ
jgi:hypothetical protein